MKKKRNFLDYLFDVIMELSAPSPETDKVAITKEFLSSLPGSFLFEDKKLESSTLIKGSITCSPETYLRLSPNERKGKKIDFEFREVGSGRIQIAELSKEGQTPYVGAWQDVVDRLVHEMAPGDRILQSNLSEKNFFHAN